MATPRTRQTHQRRVEKIAADAAKKVADASPLQEDVIVTIEEVPSSDDLESLAEAFPDVAPAAREAALDVSAEPKRYGEATASIARANASFVQQVWVAQLRFAGRMAEAMLPRGA